MPSDPNRTVPVQSPNGRTDPEPLTDWTESRGTPLHRWEWVL